MSSQVRSASSSRQGAVMSAEGLDRQKPTKTFRVASTQTQLVVEVAKAATPTPARQPSAGTSEAGTSRAGTNAVGPSAAVARQGEPRTRPLTAGFRQICSLRPGEWHVPVKGSPGIFEKIGPWKPRYCGVMYQRRNPVEVLYERGQAIGFRPTFIEGKVEGVAHALQFTFQVSNGRLNATGQGQSKRHARQAAAKSLLEKLDQEARPNKHALPEESSQEPVDGKRGRMSDGLETPPCRGTP